MSDRSRKWPPDSVRPPARYCTEFSEAIIDEPIAVAEMVKSVRVLGRQDSHGVVALVTRDELQQLRGAAATRPQAVPSPAVADAVKPMTGEELDGMEPVIEPESPNAGCISLAIPAYRRLLALARAGMGALQFAKECAEFDHTQDSREHGGPRAGTRCLTCAAEAVLRGAARRNTGEGR